MANENTASSSTSATRITTLHPRGGGRFEAEIDANTTGRDAINGLVEAGFIEPANGSDAYSLELVRTHKSLPLSTALIASGVQSGDTLQVVLAQSAAALSPAALRDRLAYDHRIIAAISSPILERVTAFADEASFAADRALDPASCREGRGVIYRVDYRMPIHSAPGVTMDRARLRLDLLAGGDYPYSMPFAQFVSRPIPFSPHVAGSGGVCLGNGWTRARGRMLAAQLIIHVARILNFDEPATNDGYSADAINYARVTLGGRAFDPTLEYPSLPTVLAYGVGAKVGGFRAVQVGAAAQPIAGRFVAARGTVS